MVAAAEASVECEKDACEGARLAPGVWPINQIPGRKLVWAVSIQTAVLSYREAKLLGIQLKLADVID